MVNNLGIFVDTGVFVAARNSRDINHEKAKRLLKKALSGEWGEVFTSSHVFDEAVALALVRTRRPEIAIDIGNFILSSTTIRMLFVDKEAFKLAWKIFRKYADRRLSFTDATSIALMKLYKTEYIMSFDRHFDGIVSRIS